MQAPTQGSPSAHGAPVDIVSASDAARLARLEAVLAAAGLGCWEMELPTGDVEVSAAAATLLLAPEAAPRASLEQWLWRVCAPDRERFVSLLQHSSETPFCDILHLDNTDAHPPHCVVVHGVRMDGRVSGIVAPPRHVRRTAPTTDVTDRRSDELQRRALDKLTATGRMAARVAHEINNPLAGIKAAFRLVKGEIPVTSEHYHYVGRIEREIDRIAHIVRLMFDLYRPAGESSQRTDVRALIDDMAHLLLPQLRERHLRLSTDVRGIPSGAPIDEALLRPVVYNLVQNAIEASPPGALVTARAEVDDRRLVLEVEDEGHGIPPGFHRQIFEPFFTTKSGLTTGGLGLGLPIAQQCVASLGGTLTFTSTAGRGTTFRVVIPLHPEHSA